MKKTKKGKHGSGFGKENEMCYVIRRNSGQELGEANIESPMYLYSRKQNQIMKVLQPSFGCPSMKLRILRWFLHLVVPKVFKMNSMESSRA